MTFKTFASVSLFALLGFGAIAAQASTQAPVPVQTYHYGQKLDVHKVLSFTQADSHTCGVTTEQMDYLDSKGAEHRVQYQAIGNNCADN